MNTTQILKLRFIWSLFTNQTIHNVCLIEMSLANLRSVIVSGRYVSITWSVRNQSIIYNICLFCLSYLRVYLQIGIKLFNFLFNLATLWHTVSVRREIINVLFYQICTFYIGIMLKSYNQSKRSFSHSMLSILIEFKWLNLNVDQTRYHIAL